MIHIDKIYINQLSHQLERFTQKKDNLYNCRCPLCGDSKTKAWKARGFFYQKGNQFNYMCHNCGASMTLSNFIKKIDPVAHKQYIFERFKQGSTGRAVSYTHLRAHET